jgi:hypothetical protein
MADENSNDNQERIWPEDDKAIYIPDKEYHSIMESLRKMEQVQMELHKIRNSINNEELRI